MKLSKYIEGLQKQLKEEGDSECYYRADDEGNSYQEVDGVGYPAYVRSLDYCVDCVYDIDELEDELDDEESVEDFIKICVIN